MNAKIVLEIAPERLITGGKEHFINIKIIYKSKVHEAQELVEENILKSHFDYLFDKLKFLTKDALKKELVED